MPRAAPSFIRLVAVGIEEKPKSKTPLSIKRKDIHVSRSVGIMDNSDVQSNRAALSERCLR